MCALSLEMLENCKTRILKHPTPRFPYLGAGAKNKLIEPWLELQATTKFYVDPVAGSCNQPFVVGKTHNVPAIVSDASYYSHCIGCGLFHRCEDTNLDMVRELLVGSQDLPIEGYFATNFKIVPEVGQYIDSLIVGSRDFPEPDMHFFLACVGAAILSRYSLRCLCFFHKGGQITNPGGDTPTIEDFALAVYKRIVSKNRYHTPGTAYWSSMPTVLDYLDLTGATVNLDPAWPFAKKSMAKLNPYHFYTEIGDILKQGCSGRMKFWQDETPEAVLREFIFWVQRCLERGAREVFVWNQTTNNPSYTELLDALQSRWPSSEEVLRTTRGSIGHKSTFEDYVLRVRP